MEGNKDEALRCVKLAKTALYRERAVKFIRIAQRLDPSLPIADLLAAAENLDSLNGTAKQKEIQRDQPRAKSKTPKESAGPSSAHQIYTEEEVRVIREIRKNKDYYAILGVERSSSVEEIRKAYKKLSLKVHPDKNKAPGAEDAFKLVSKAFKCLSNEQSRKTYDQTGTIEDREFNEQYPNVMRQRTARYRRQARSHFYDYKDDFDPDEIFRPFFYGTQENLFRAHNVHRARGMRTHQQRERPVQGGSGINFTVLMHLAWVLVFVLFAFLPSPQPEYSLQKTHYFPIPKVTEKHGVEYFVSKEDFDQQFPQGSSSRDNLEHYVLKDYRSLLGRYCHMELQRRRWARDYPTPHCDKLRSLAVA